LVHREIVQTVAIAVKMKATKADFDATFALHLTWLERPSLLRFVPGTFERVAWPPFRMDSVRSTL